MDPNDTTLNSYYHHLQSLHQHPTPSPSYGLQLNPDPAGAASTPSPLIYTHSVQPAHTSADAALRRKRGRPRKYGTPEQALAAKKTTSLSAVAQGLQKKRESCRDVPNKSEQQNLSELGNAGQGFTSHIIDLTAGEDVSQRIMLFMQQSKRELCILSASGSISNASLRQPATSGGGIMYEGRFELVSLSGSYVRTDNGERSGGLSVCLSDTNGQIIGGGVGGPLVAAGPVQVIVGSFLIVPNKGNDGGIKGNSPASQLPSPLGCASKSGGGYRPAAEAAGRVQGSSNNDHQNIVVNPFLIQSRNMHVAPPQATTGWMGDSDARSGGSYEFLGRGGACPSDPRKIVITTKWETR